MHSFFKKTLMSSSAVAVAVLATSLTMAGLTPANAQDDDVIIITGVPKATTKLDSSSSVTALEADDIRDIAPRSTAELFRSLPGIHAEASSGDANTNVKVRGLPISAGGSRYVSFQEDGFPTLLVGDTAFATPDSFLRFDSTVGSVQSIRGGTSSTLAPNAPGGIINFISKTGEEQGGSVALTTGLDYNSVRADFEYGAPINDQWSYHIGGFYRSGEGPRSAPANIEQGGQIKATLAGNFDRGSMKIHFKHLDDKVPTYLPIPAIYNGGTSFSAVGVDLGDGTLFLDETDYAVRRDGNIDAVDGDGFESKMTSIALVGDYELTEQVTASFKHRTASIEGNFAAPFPASVFDTAGVDPSVVIVYFNTKLRDFDNSFTDLNLGGDFEAFSGKIGVEFTKQNIGTDWNFNQYYRRLDGSLTSFDMGNSVNGVLYGNPAFGNCCTRAYEFDIEGTAPYIALSGTAGAFSWDASYRKNDYKVSGFFAEAANQAPLDVNGDGTIGANEQAVNSVGASAPADYDVDFDAWSVGASFALNDEMALFANISEGGSLSSPDRVTGSIAVDGSIQNEAGYSLVEQYELGFKYQGDNGSFYATYFNADTTESRQFEVTTQTFIETAFEASGFEFEGDYDFGNGFGVRANATFTDSEIVRTASGANVGNQPRRQADYIFNIMPYYEAERWDVGLAIFGTDEVFVQDNNSLKFDGYVTTGLFANFNVTDNMSVSLNANNLFDKIGFTEGEEGTASPGDYVRIRPINGRTVSASLRYTF